MATIQTATGPIDSDDLGFTLTHEHVVVGSPPVRQQFPDLFDREAILAIAVPNLIAAREAGVRTIVDLTPITLGRDAGLIRDAAQRSGVQIIVATGLYYFPDLYFAFASIEHLTALFVRDINDGIGDTGVRAGVIKCATQPDMNPFNEKVLRASAQAHRQTGVPIGTHTFVANRTGLDQTRVFHEEGVDLGRVIIGHSDDTDDISYLEDIIETGAYIGMDRIGIPRPRTSEERADMVAALVERGYASRVCLSHDSGVMEGYDEALKAERSPDWRYTFIPREFSALLRERGVSDDAITQMTVANPRTIFGQTEPY
ncbi:MAG: phosphotriesterase-related protein [Chloroflexi bacterium]|nr:phosphotriesterase-related protein [Chloroflexota bacterium]MDA1145620.1 phosphotriesterase-related protein [Chloroflexota bacterium]